jgi:hypothetical protein
LGDSWLPLTGSTQQRAAAATLTRDVQPYVSASTFADTVLNPPVTIDAEPGLESYSTLLRAGNRQLTYRLSPEAFLDYATSSFEVRVDSIRVA